MVCGLGLLTHPHPIHAHLTRPSHHISNSHICTPCVSPMKVRDRVVSDDHGAQLMVKVPKRGIWGTAGINGLNLDQ